MSAIEILEQAVLLLRGAPARAVTAYLAGAVPFVLALLFFLNDMTRNAFAFDHLAVWSLALAILYVWKNVWQATFAAELYETLSPGTKRARNPLRLIAIQAALQPIGLFLTLPIPWLPAFFRNVALFAALGRPDAVRLARKQAGLWTGQNWGVMGLITLAAVLLFANVLVMIVVLPQLARSFLGIEGDLARLGARMLNVSTMGAAAALTWLFIDPLLDAVYVLRCYFGESIATGEDLLAALRRVVVLLLLVSCIVPAARAQVDPQQLDHSIDQVIHGREFAWRTPRTEASEPQSKWVGWVRAAQRAVKQGWDWLWTLLRRLFEREQKPESEGSAAAVSRRAMEALIGVAIALVAGAVIFFFMRQKTPVVAAQAVTIAATVNVADESVTADQLPERSWLQLAEELLAKGDARLALRALYLAGLNYLSGRGLVSIQRWKSGLDYRRELERRARATPAVSQEFAKINGMFEYGWYGIHTVDRATVESFAAGLNAMRKNAESSS
jgi:hypothetical protein